MKIMARACGHTHLNELALDDLVTWKEDMARCLRASPTAGSAASERYRPFAPYPVTKARSFFANSLFAAGISGTVPR